LTPSGALDGGFAGDGFTRIAVPIHVARATAVTLLPGGQIVVGGKGEGQRGFRDDSTFIARLLGGRPDSVPPRVKLIAAKRGGAHSVFLRLRSDEDCVVRVSGDVRRHRHSRVALKSRTITLQRGRARRVRLRTRDELTNRAARVHVTAKARDSAANSARFHATLRLATR
jgi:hypothetical protein